MSLTLPSHGGPDSFDRSGTLNGKPSIPVNDAAIQLDRSGFEWGGALGTPATVTYAFRADAQDPLPAGVSGFTRFTPDQMADAQLSLQAWSDVANITFVRQGTGATGDAAYSDDAQILFSGASSLSSQESGLTIRPANPAGATVNVYINDPETSATLGPGGFGAAIITHEIGHSIGLDHPSYYNQSDSSAPTYADDALYAEDDRQYSVMSYFAATETGGNFTIRPQAPMMDDIAAAQRLYGANMATRADDTVYGFHSNTDRPWYSLTDPGQGFAACIWDGGGNDTLDFSLYAQNQFIDMREGAFSNVGGGIGNLSIYPGVAIENAIAGSGNDLVLGNIFANTILGLDGADTLVGNGGHDSLFGNAGNDVIFTGSASTIPGAATTDGVFAFGGQGDDVIDARGSSASNVLSGDAGADTLYSGAGFETVLGGQGDDVLVGGATAGPGSLQLLFGNQGADTLSYAGGGSVELFGGQDDDTLSVTSTSQGQTRFLFGNLGDDTLTASGGSDSLYGGQGNDSLATAGDTAGRNYLSGDLGDDRITTGAGGSDTVRGGLGADTVTLTAHGSGAGDTVVIGAGDSTAAQGAGETNLDHILGFAFGSDHVAIAGHAAGSSANVAVYSDAAANASEAAAFSSAYLYAYGDGTAAHAAHLGATAYLAVQESYAGSTTVYLFTQDHVAVAFTGDTAAMVQAGAIVAG